MKTLGKVLAMVLALSLTFSFVSFAAFSDVAADANYKDAVDLLTAINIIKGYEDGTFKPDETITRAEFAAVVCRTLGLESAAAGSMAEIFTDVPVDNWANGYIALASQAKVINGYGDGTFGPSDPVTYEQAVKMLVCAIGYLPKAEALGGYPTGYIVVANQEGMTVGVNGTIGQPAKRSTVSKLAYNSLSIKLFEQDGWNPYAPTYTKSDDTLLSSKLKIAKVEGNITQVNFTKDSIDDTTFTIAAGKGDDAYKTIDADLAGSPTAAVPVKLKTGGIDVKSMQEFICTAYINTSEDDYVLTALIPKSSKNTTVAISSTAFDNMNAAMNVVQYYKDGSNSLTDVELNPLVAVGTTPALKVYVNGELVATPATKAAFETEFNKSTEIKFLDNGDTSKYDVIFLKQYDTMVAGDIYDRTFKISASSSSDAIQTGRVLQITLDPEDTQKTFGIFDEQGNALTFADIKTNDVLSLGFTGFVSSSNYKYLEVIVSKNTITGTVSEIGTDSKGSTTYNIGGTNYKLAAAGSLAIGDEGTYALSKFGRIALKTVTTTNANYGFIIDIAQNTTSSIGTTTVDALILTDKGEAVISKLASTIRIDQGDVTNQAYLEGSGAQDTRTVKVSDLVATLLNYKGKMVAYTMNSSSELTKMVARYINMGTDLKYTTGVALYKAFTGKLGSFYINDTTSLVKFSKDIAVATATEKTDKANYSLITTSGLVDDSNYDCRVIYDSVSREIKFGFINNFVGTVDPVSSPVVISSVGTANDTDGNTVSSITGFQGLEVVSFKTNWEAKAYNFKNVEIAYTPAKGDVIQFTKNGAGEADVIRVLFQPQLSTAGSSVLVPGYAIADGFDAVTGRFITAAVDNKESYPLAAPIQGFAYYGKLADANTSFASFVTSGTKTDDIDLRNTVVYMVNKGTTTRVTEATIGDAETIKNNAGDINNPTSASYIAADAQTDDIVFVYRYDAATTLALIVDVNNDN